MHEIHIATLDTRHFSFEAYGLHPTAALVALKDTLDKHAEQYGLDVDWYAPDEIGLQVRLIGRGYRDGEPLP
jgi:hypothetical protein